MTVKTIAIVAGVGVGVFVLVKMLAPRTTASPTKAKSLTDLISLQGLLGAGSALSNFFGGSSSGPANFGTFDGGAYADPLSQAALRNFDSDNYSVSNGFAFTDASGNFIAG